MAMDVSTERAVCAMCGTAFSKYRGNFNPIYSELTKGVGHLPICKNCVEVLYNRYLSQSNSVYSAVRQVCRKLDLYWSDQIFDSISAKSTNRTAISMYLSRLCATGYVGKSYDDTLAAEGNLWSFSPTLSKAERERMDSIGEADKTEDEEEKKAKKPVPKKIVEFWGKGYTPELYEELEKRRAYWMSGFPDGTEIDVSTEGLIRQICALEVDITRDRAAGKSVDKNVQVLNTLLGSANLKPAQRKQDDNDAALQNTPLGVWLYRYENERPLPDVDEKLKDKNHIMRYIFVWMGHVLKMLGQKNGYEKLYEDEVARLRVEHPEYDGDDEEFMSQVFDEDGGGSG